MSNSGMLREQDRVQYQRCTLPLPPPPHAVPPVRHVPTPPQARDPCKNLGRTTMTAPCFACGGGLKSSLRARLIPPFRLRISPLARLDLLPDSKILSEHHVLSTRRLYHRDEAPCPPPCPPLNATPVDWKESHVDHSPQRLRTHRASRPSHCTASTCLSSCHPCATHICPPHCMPLLPLHAICHVSAPPQAGDRCKNQVVLACMNCSAHSRHAQPGIIHSVPLPLAGGSFPPPANPPNRSHHGRYAGAVYNFRATSSLTKMVLRRIVVTWLSATNLVAWATKPKSRFSQSERCRDFRIAVEYKEGFEENGQNVAERNKVGLGDQVKVEILTVQEVS
jgi:hypothetical protein